MAKYKEPGEKVNGEKVKLQSFFNFQKYSEYDTGVQFQEF